MLAVLVATLAVAFHVPVTCDFARQPAPWQNAVAVYHPEQHAAQLLPELCGSLAEARAGTMHRDGAIALHILGHELAHSYGVSDETGADCVGGMLVGFVGRSLGFSSAAVGRAWLLDAQWREQSCAAWDQRGAPF